jgi:glycerol-3-phosphate O-acyltransferase
VQWKQFGIKHYNNTIYGEIMETINKSTYVKLININAKWLVDNTKNSLEREHILKVLWDSIDLLYPKPPTERPKPDGNLRDIKLRR